jgi:hypothetical protein
MFDNVKYTLLDWPIWVNLGNKDQEQPWAPGEPAVYPFVNVSNIAVMMNSDGNWFTVNTANNATTANDVLCVRHTTFVLHNLTGNINRFFRYYQTANLNYQDGRALCLGQDADFNRLYGPAGRNAMLYMDSNGMYPSEFWLGISNIENNMTRDLWTAVDGEIKLV